MAQPTKARARLVGIDVLRGAAALAVVLVHGRGDLWVGLSKLWDQFGISANPTAILGYLSAPIRFGGLGVQLFFVLSGYCIHRRAAIALTTEPTFKLDYRQYALRRIWRIYPAYLFAILLTFCIDFCVSNYMGITHRADRDYSGFAMLSNTVFLQGFATFMFGSNTPFWTLAIEMQFYLFYPVLLFISRRWGAHRCLTFAFSVSLTYVIANRLLDIDSFFPHRHHSGGPTFIAFLFTWTFGAYIADVEAGRAPLWRSAKYLAIPAMAGAMVLDLVKYKDFAEFGYALAFSVLTWWVIQPERQWVSRTSRVFAWLGIFSYSLYLTHRPFFQLWKGLATDKRSISLLPTFGACGFAIGGAYVFYWAFEKWTTKLPNWLKHPLGMTQQ